MAKKIPKVVPLPKDDVERHKGKNRKRKKGRKPIAGGYRDPATGEWLCLAGSCFDPATRPADFYRRAYEREKARVAKRRE